MIIRLNFFPMHWAIILQYLFIILFVYVFVKHALALHHFTFMYYLVMFALSV